MIASKIPKVKGALRATTFAEARTLWEHCRVLATAREVEALVDAELGGRLQQLALAREEASGSEAHDPR
jgi:hypothetical protein